MSESSTKLYDDACRLFPGGVNSPVRAWKNVGGTPRFIAAGRGAMLTDVDGRTYCDFVGSWGAAIAGHAHPAVVAAVQRAAGAGLGFGAPTPGEIALGGAIVDAMPSIERLRFVSSGTEAAMSAVRVARAFTGRQNILKFSGCYHGHTDALLVRAGSGLATFGVPDSAGVPDGCTASTAVAAYNAAGEVESYISAHGSDLAAIIVEPIAANMGVVLPDEDFLARVRAATGRCGALLILDEVITGFRLGRGGAQAATGIVPDLTCLGKIIGGGLPVGAFGGRAEIMDLLAPLGPVYQAGTLAGNPVAMAAGDATLQLLDDAAYARLEALGAQVEEALTRTLADRHVRGAVVRAGSMFTIFFGIGRPRSYDDVSRTDRTRFRQFFFAMLERGFYLPPSPFEAAFISLAHERQDIEAFTRAADEALRLAA